MRLQRSHRRHRCGNCGFRDWGLAVLVLRFAARVYLCDRCVKSLHEELDKSRPESVEAVLLP